MFCATKIGVMTIGVKAEKRGVGKTLIKHLSVVSCECVLIRSRQISLLKGGLLFFCAFFCTVSLSDFFCSATAAISWRCFRQSSGYEETCMTAKARMCVCYLSFSCMSVRLVDAK